MRRRDLLHTGALALPGLFAANAFGTTTESKAGTSCIVLMLTGGPSQLDTWDMKPEAPGEIRGPFRPIKTNVPGIEISEIFPRMARHADKYTLVRSVYHDAPSSHEASMQVMQTGRRWEENTEYPSIGSVVARLTGSAHGILPSPLFSKDAGLAAEPAGLRSKYGLNQFGQSCLLARRLVEAGTRFVTVNMFQSVLDGPTWDAHGYAPFSSLDHYRDSVGPMFDMAYSSLLEDLSVRGLLSQTLVVAMGEFGRSPRINPDGGRDHWNGCSTVLLAGGGTAGGEIIGSSDRIGAEPKDHPVNPAMLAATICSVFGISTETACSTQSALREIFPGNGPHP